MPEGDSYTRARERIAPVVVGREVRSLDGVPAVRKQARRLIGRTVTGVRTNGKHLLFDFDNGWSIHVWLGMPGRFAVRSGARRAFTEGRGRDERSLTDAGAVRLRLGTDAGEALVYSAPVVEVERTHVIDTDLASLGPDVLADEFDWDGYAATTARVAPVRATAAVLLDQRVLAGVGNEYKNEILFLERIHPLTPFGTLDASSRRSLAERAIALMTPNARRPGARVTTGRARDDQRLWVYGRAGRPCRRCRTPIEVARLGDPHPRITYWCPRCQPATGPTGRSRSDASPVRT